MAVEISVIQAHNAPHVDAPNEAILGADLGHPERGSEAPLGNRTPAGFRGRRHGAGNEDRTRIPGMGSQYSAVELYPQAKVRTIVVRRVAAVTAPRSHSTDRGPGLSAASVHYLRWCRDVRRLSVSTLTAYEETLAHLEAHLRRNGGDPDWVTVTAGDLIGFITRTRRHGKPPAPATQRRDRAVCQQLFRYLVNQRIISTDPMFHVPVPKVRNRSPKAIPDDVWLTLWHSPHVGLDDRLWLGLGYFAGLRRVEIATLNVSCVDLAREELRFYRKGGSEVPIEYGALARVVGERLGQLRSTSDQWLDILTTTARVRADDNHLVPSMTGRLRNDTNWFNKRLVTLRRQVGLTNNITPHSLRHSCATNLLRARVPETLIADQLSHASVDTTRRYLATSGQLARLTDGR